MRLEIEDSSKHNEEIAARWTVVTALEVPQEIARQITNQRKVGPFLLVSISLLHKAQECAAC